MTHYICEGGCKGENPTPDVCGDPNCRKHNQPFSACDCADGKHDGKFDTPSPEPETPTTI